MIVTKEKEEVMITRTRTRIMSMRLKKSNREEEKWVMQLFTKAKKQLLNQKQNDSS